MLSHIGRYAKAFRLYPLCFILLAFMSSLMLWFYSPFLRTMKVQHPHATAYFTKEQSLNNKLIRFIQHLAKAQRFERDQDLLRKFHKVSFKLAEGINEVTHSNSTTLIIDAINEIHIENLLHILQQMLSFLHKDINIVAGITLDEYNSHKETFLSFEKRLKHNLKIIPLPNESRSARQVLLTLVAETQTEFIIITRNLEFLDGEAFTKMVLPLLTKTSDIVGATVLMSDMTVRSSCYQMKTLWYQLLIQPGFDVKTNNGYMICDYVSGPFALSKKIFFNYLKTLKSNYILNSDMFYLEFFHRLSIDTKTSVKVCQHCVLKSVVYFRNTFAKLDRSHWLTFSKRNDVSEIFLQTESESMISYVFLAQNSIYNVKSKVKACFNKNAV